VAFGRVATNHGANTPGVDGVTAAYVEVVAGVPGLLDDLRAALKDGSFRPLPVRERKIPKPGGSGKVRKLGIPGIADRVVQAASAEQTLWEEEEAILKNPATESWQRYAVQSSRDARAANRQSMEAIRQSQDIADKASFNQFKLTKPKMFEKYAGKVESMLAEMRKNGNNAPREELLALLIGRDMRDGKMKTTETKGTKRVVKKLPGARSDTRSSGGKLSDSEARAKRLEGVRI
jgi:hypothetical protein